MICFVCKNCGSGDFREEDGYRICNHCNAKYIITSEDKRIVSSTIELNEDIARLLSKCKTDPDRAYKYAQRILEIDPSNQEAAKILSSHLRRNYTNNGGCYVATAVYGSYDCPQVWTLRRYRDNTLAATWYGRAFIHTYYAISPTLVKWFGHTNWFKSMWRGQLDKMVKSLQKQGIASTPYQDKKW